jgi:hypothetical protein
MGTKPLTYGPLWALTLATAGSHNTLCVGFVYQEFRALDRAWHGVGSWVISKVQSNLLVYELAVVPSLSPPSSTPRACPVTGHLWIPSASEGPDTGRVLNGECGVPSHPPARFALLHTQGPGIGRVITRTLPFDLLQ